MDYTDIGYVKELTLKQLNPNEQLLSINRSKNQHSAYFTIFRQPHQVLVFRISDHETVKGYFKNPTFDHRDQDLHRKIADYLDADNWVNLDYSTYAALNILAFSKKRRTQFYVDDSFGTFSQESMAALFYAEFYSKGSRKEVLTFSKGFIKILRRLYAHGLINVYKPQYGKTSVYVTKAGYDSIKAVNHLYLESWQKDRKGIQWWRLDIPRYVWERQKSFQEEERAKRRASLQLANPPQEKVAPDTVSKPVIETEPARPQGLWGKIKAFFRKLFAKKVEIEPAVQESPPEIQEVKEIQPESEKPEPAKTPAKKAKPKAKIRQPNLVKESWKRAMDSRHKVHLDTNLDQGTLAKLQAFKEDLDS